MTDPSAMAADLDRAAAWLADRAEQATPGPRQVVEPGDHPGYDVVETRPSHGRRNRQVVARVGNGKWAEDRANADLTAALGNPQAALALAGVFRVAAEAVRALPAAAVSAAGPDPFPDLPNPPGPPDWITRLWRLARWLTGYQLEADRG